MTERTQWLYQFQVGKRLELAKPGGWTEGRIIFIADIEFRGFEISGERK